MKEDIMQRLAVTINALNSISVSGKANLTNLSGSIAMLEEIGALLNSADITPNDDAEKNK
jgi:hypothetical protein|nr:MAG TPA: hypothetical protein [Caudoviricetes sp.]